MNATKNKAPKTKNQEPLTLSDVERARDEIAERMKSYRLDANLGRRSYHIDIDVPHIAVAAIWAAVKKGLLKVGETYTRTELGRAALDRELIGAGGVGIFHIQCDLAAWRVPAKIVELDRFDRSKNKQYRIDPR